MKITIKILLISLYKKFKNNKFYSYKDSQIILSFIIKKNILWIIINENKYLLKKKIIYIYNILFKKKIKGLPLEYIIKKCYFNNNSFYINRLIFIPRIETELLLEITLKKINILYKKYKLINLLELGTGSGSISISIAKKYKFIKILATDYSNNILNIAKYNAYKLNINNILFKLSDWFNNIEHQLFNIIVSNPPYIDNNDFYYKYTNIKYEPYKALLSNANGYYDLVNIINKAYNWLYKEGWIILEHSWYQSNLLYDLLKYKKFINIKNIKGYNNNNRIIYAQK